MNGTTIKVNAHRGRKCPRCWHYHYLPNPVDELCDRCQLVLLEQDNVNADLKSKITKRRLQEMKLYCIRKEDSICQHIKCCRSYDGLSKDPKNELTNQNY